MSKEIDEQVIEQLLELSKSTPDDDLAGNLVQLFDSETPKRIAEIKNAVKNQDYSGLNLAAHSLKSGSCYLGAMALSETSKVIELSAHDNKIPDNIDELIDKLENSFTAASQFLNTKIAS